MSSAYLMPPGTNDDVIDLRDGSDLHNVIIYKTFSPLLPILPKRFPRLPTIVRKRPRNYLESAHPIPQWRPIIKQFIRNTCFGTAKNYHVLVGGGGAVHLALSS